MKYRRKKIWLTLDKKKYCYVRVYPDKASMQEAYRAYRSYDGKNGWKILGAHSGYTRYVCEKGKRCKTLPETGTVWLSKENCGAGIVAHELMHAVIWARTHRARWTDQYPFVIKNMNEEEKLLHNLTYAIRQFYTWFYDQPDLAPKK